MIEIILSLLICANAKTGILALENNPAEKFVAQHSLKGSVSEWKDLPEQFYGTWKVISTVQETNRPDIFEKGSVDIWTFQKRGEVITLINPLTGAKASITVNQVQGNTARFTRIKNEGGIIEIETPEITVDKNTFYGTDIIKFEYSLKNNLLKSTVGKYKIKGFRIVEN
jgi:hypothetical protein